MGTGIPERLSPAVPPALFRRFQHSGDAAADLLAPGRIFVIEPTMFCAPWALVTARLANAKVWLHIQDFEVEAFFGLGFSSGGFVKKCVNAVEGWLMRRFDRVSSISRQMVGRLSAFGIAEDRTTIFPNWVDTDRIRPGIRGRDFREEWGLGPERKIVLYAGSMGKKQGLEMVLETARALQNDEPDIIFPAGRRRIGKRRSRSTGRCAWFAKCLVQTAAAAGGFPRIADAGGRSPGGPEERGSPRRSCPPS